MFDGFDQFGNDFIELCVERLKPEYLGVNVVERYVDVQVLFFEVFPQLRPVLAVAFPSEAFDPVAVHGVVEFPFRRGDKHPRPIAVVNGPIVEIPVDAIWEEHHTVPLAIQRFDGCLVVKMFFFWKNLLRVQVAGRKVGEDYCSVLFCSFSASRWALRAAALALRSSCNCLYLVLSANTDLGFLVVLELFFEVAEAEVLFFDEATFGVIVVSGSFPST